MMPPNSPGAPMWPAVALARMEWRIGARTAAFRFAAIGAFLLGCSLGNAPGRGSALSAYGTAETAWQYLGFVAVIWVSVAAVRETTQRTDILVFSKPQPGERLALAKFVGAMLQIAAFAAALFMGSICSRLVGGGGLLGGSVYLVQAVRVLVVLFFAASASYALALLFDSAIAGALIGLYWLLTLSGQAFLGKFYFPAYTQNQGAYVCLSLALLSITLLLYRRSRRGDAPTALWVRAAAPVFLLLTAWQFWTIVRDGHDPLARLNPILERMGEQDTVIGQRAAGFSLPDQQGRLTGLSRFPGRILVVALWSPHDPDSVLLLDRLNDLQARFGSRGVQAIAIGLGEDNGAAPDFARGEDVRFPVVTDWGVNSAPGKSEISPMASAYRANLLPTVVVTDRRRRVRVILRGTECYDGGTLDKDIVDRLAEQPR